MARYSNHPLFPDFERAKDALRVLLYVRGGQFHALWARDTYEPLADFLGLNQEVRSVLRSEYLNDGRNEAYWHTWVQWAKDRLVNAGEIECPRHGLWMLTEAGVRHAQQVQARLDEKAILHFAKYPYEQVSEGCVMPITKLTLEDLDL